MKYLKILKIAASLHDLGERVRHYMHAKHSWYMGLNSAIYGATRLKKSVNYRSNISIRTATGIPSAV